MHKALQMRVAVSGVALMMMAASGKPQAQATPPIESSTRSSAADACADDAQLPLDPSTRKPFITVQEVANKTPPKIRYLTEAESKRITELDSMIGQFGGPNNTSQSIDWYREIISILNSTFGPDHPYQIEFQRGFSLNLAVNGSIAESITHSQIVLQLMIDVLGIQHPRTLDSRRILAEALRRGGRTEEAEIQSAIALQGQMDLFGPNDKSTVATIFIRSRILNTLGEYAESLKLAHDAWSISNEICGGLHPQTIAFASGYADQLLVSGELVRAENIARIAWQNAVSTFSQDDFRALILQRAYANVVRDLGHLQYAYSLSRASLIGIQKALPNDHSEVATSFYDFAGIATDLGYFDLAIESYQTAIEIGGLNFGENHPNLLTYQNGLGVAYLEAGEADRAREIFAGVVNARLISLGVGHPSVGLAYYNLATALADSKENRQAEELYRRALGLIEAGNGKNHPLASRVALNAAINLLEQRDRAYLAVDQARRGLAGRRERSRLDGSVGFRGELKRDAELHRVQSAERLFADAAWVRGAAFPAEAPGLRVESFGALQGAGSGPAARAIAETAARRYAVKAGAGELVSERARQVELWAAAERRNIAAQAQSGGQDRAAREAMERDMAAAEARIEAIDAELKVKAPQYFAIVNQPPLDVAEAQGLLGEDEAVLIVVPSEFGTHVMALTKTELVWHRADIKADEVANKVTALRRDLNPGEDARVPDLSRGSDPLRGPDAELAYRPSFDRATAHDLHTQLIAPVAATLEGKSQLFIAADGALASLPFGVLVTEAPAAGSDESDPEVLRSTPWFADSHALVQIPSLQSLAYLRRFNTGESGASGSSAAPRATTLRTAASGFAGFGDPVLSGPSGASRGAEAVNFVGSGVTESGSALMNPDLLRTLDRLSGTRTELRTISSMLGASEDALRLDVRMTESDFRKPGRLNGVKILHLATHGLKAADAGRYGQSTEPGLVFTPPAQATSQDDGYLAASEIVGIDLAGVDWVILSACDTAAPSGKPGEAGLSGLARAFFYAGAPSLLVSHWPVRDDVAAVLTVNTLRRTQAGESRAAALQNAMRDIRNDQSNPTFAHPSAWAPFTIAGEGR
ncbi:CHAT domain-containing protein [Erythrobacter donghaensis]|uniref:CHAT domain-containing protein n=1 Tax=Erythrobacter donghaensis TaxID=267135 RepID=UPI0009BE271C|nr:CHAT domain-containing protein [Erythrobacter donghaensis]